jgi:hypothetical protein
MNLGDTGQLVEYAKIFHERGHLYHAAMALARRARDLEFNQIFSRFPCSSAERIIDAPSGGAYLQDFLRRSFPDLNLEVINLEFTPGFSEEPLIVDPYGTWPVAPGWGDRAICLAASHHIANLPELLDNFYRHTRPGALIHLADVEPAGGISNFLDTFVDRYTPTGHRGIYRSFEHFRWPVWMEIRSIEVRPCHWVFASEQQMLEFCLKLFGLSEAARPELRDALDRYIGFESSGRRMLLKWELVYVDAQRR